MKKLFNLLATLWDNTIWQVWEKVKNEPVFYIWEYKSLTFIIKRLRWYLNWYVLLNEIIPEKEVNNIDCHWGITYNEYSLDRIWIMINKSYKKVLWFDTNHSWDLSYRFDLLQEFEHQILRSKSIKIDWILLFFDKCNIVYKNPWNWIYRDLNYCIEECKKIIDQIKKQD